MKLLLNDKEIANFLFSRLDHKEAAKDIEMSDNETVLQIMWVQEKISERNFNLEKFRKKIKDRIKRGVRNDLENYIKTVQTFLENRRKVTFELIHNHIEYFIEKFGEEKLLDLYKNSNYQHFVKSTGLCIDPDATLIRRKRFSSYEEDCLIRNTVGNEKLLISKVDNNHPFWFIDSGYTNFLEEKKVWHRVVRNHLHHSKQINAPVDRLGMFKKFPKQWRQSGDRILIVEPGPFAAGIFHVDLKTWKYDVESELRKYTDKKIVFREKAPKKTRENLYQHLLDEDYYCLININSNAATEAIWAGIPVITLDKHISNTVSINDLSKINQLARPNLSQWLCDLSYSQFSYDELLNGTAIKIIRGYHG